jgi:hypothetical protein
LYITPYDFAFPSLVNLRLMLCMCNAYVGNLCIRLEKSIIRFIERKKIMYIPGIYTPGILGKMVCYWHIPGVCHVFNFWGSQMLGRLLSLSHWQSLRSLCAESLGMVFSFPFFSLCPCGSGSLGLRLIDDSEGFTPGFRSTVLRTNPVFSHHCIPLFQKTTPSPQRCRFLYSGGNTS